MIVESIEQFEEAVRFLSTCEYMGFDTETTGLLPFKGDQMFFLSCSGLDKDTKQIKTFSWSFQDYGNGVAFWDHSHITHLARAFRSGVRFAHNAKFDMHFLGKNGLDIGSEIHDTEVIARVLYNQHLKYNLHECCVRDLGEQKDDGAMNYITEHHLWDWISIDGEKTNNKRLYFQKIPYDIMLPYCEQDTELTLKLGLYQLDKLKKMDEEIKSVDPKLPTPMNVYELEKKLTKVCYQMERVGIKIDREYCEKAAAYEQARIEKAQEGFFALTGTELTDSGKELGPLFEGLGFTLWRNQAGNVQVTDDFLEMTQHPVAKIVQEYRDASKRCNTYFRGFLYHADDNDLVHATMKSGGTKTGRFSYQNPNLQNIPKSEGDDSLYPVRRAFIPHKGNMFVMIDYQAMEFRMILDYAGQKNVIEKIKAGHDPHQATADDTGLSRKDAKTLNFAIGYGAGLDRIAFLTGQDKNGAKKTKAKYFDGMDKVEEFFWKCKDTVKNRGYVFNWLGRRSYFPDLKFSYRAPNAIIQGGAADVVKKAMVDLHTALPSFGADMRLQIHDELIVEMPVDNAQAVVMWIKETMERAYPYKSLPLTCSVSSSLESWSGATEGVCVEESRDDAKRKSTLEVEGAKEHVV